MEFRDVDWTTLPPGSMLENHSIRAPDYRTTYAEWAYVNVNSAVAKMTLLNFVNSPVNQMLEVQQRDGSPWIASSGFSSKPSLVEQGSLVMERSGALAMASIILAVVHGESPEEVNTVLAAHGLEIRSVE